MGYSNQAMRQKNRGQPRTYDFRRPVRLAREHTHLLKLAMGTWGRTVGTVLTTSLRTNSAMVLAELEEMSYDEFIATVPEDTMCLVLSLDPLPGKGILTLDVHTLFIIVDFLLGGPGTQKQPERGLTDIEQAVVRNVVDRLLKEFTYAIEQIVHTKPRVHSLESNAQFVQSAAPTEPMIVVRYDLIVGEKETQLSISLPYGAIAEALRILDASQDDQEALQARAQAAVATKQRIQDVQVDVNLRFDPVLLASEKIWELTAGDVVTFEHRTTTPLAITSADSCFGYAVPGASGKRLAALVVPPPGQG